jgi:hypothetical protein
MAEANGRKSLEHSGFDRLVEPGRERIDHVCKDLRVIPHCTRSYMKGMIRVRNQL